MASTHTDQSTNDEPTREDARRRLSEAHRGGHDEIVGDLSQLHGAATSFLALLDSHAPDELPDDLDGDTKRQFNTARTQLPKAISGIVDAAHDRLLEQHSTESEDDEYDKTPIESITELETGDNVDVFYGGGWIHATVVETNVSGCTSRPTIEIKRGSNKYRIREYEDKQVLFEWAVGTEEDFADWRQKGGNIKNIEKVEEITGE